jgi:hypothetical protein
LNTSLPFPCARFCWPEHPLRRGCWRTARDVLAELILDGLASADAERMLCGADVRRFRITDASGCSLR